MPSKNSVTPEPLMHPHWEELGRKLLFTLIGIFVLYALVYVGTLIRNNLKTYETIGYADKMERSITLDAEGTATAKPDIAMTTIGMYSEADTVAEAQEENTRIMNNVIAKLKELGIHEDDIQTANYNVYPLYDWDEEGRELVSYEVSQSVTVKIRDLDKANQVLGLAGETGVNSVSGLQFIIDDTSVYVAEARQDAIKKIQDKAAGLSSMLGMQIGEVTSYYEYETSGNDYGYYDRAYAMESSFGYAPDIESGTEDITVDVTITFEMR